MHKIYSILTTYKTMRYYKKIANNCVHKTKPAFASFGIRARYKSANWCQYPTSGQSAGSACDASR